MIKLKWIEDKKTGHQRAYGQHTQYLLTDGSWHHLESVTIEVDEFKILKHGAFYSAEDAMAMAEKHENTESEL